MNNVPLILIIEDDPAILSFLVTSLDAAGYRTVHAANLAQALVEAQSRTPDLTLLDLGLPDGDGLTLIPKIRAFSALPILVVSARGQEADKIAALDLGADDFIPKPFSAGELHARIRAALRRTRPSTPVFTFGPVTIDFDARRVQRNGEEVHLTPTEYKLLTLLIDNQGKALTHRFLLTNVWGPQSLDQSQYLRVYMTQLRRKLELEPSRPQHFKTEPGVGYRFLA